MRQRRRLWALAGILLFAFGLRAFRLGAQSLWYDETVSLHLAGQSIPELVAHTAGDIHPPGYYLLLHAWTRLAGRSEFSAAFASLWFGVLLVALAYRLGSRVFGPAAGLCGAALVALSPFNLWYSQEVRMYTLGAALAMGVLGCAVELVGRPAAGPRAWRALAGYALLAALGLWVLYYFAFLLAALNLLVVAWWLIARRRRQAGWGWLGRWLAAQALALALFAPWLPVAWRQATSPPVPPWRSLTSAIGVAVESWSALSVGQSAVPAKVWPALLLTALLFGLGLAAGLFRVGGACRSPLHIAPGAGTHTGPWLLAGTVVLPLLLIWLASFVTPLYHVRYVFTYSTPFYCIVAAGVVLLWRRCRPAAWIGLAALLGFSAASIWAYHTDARYAADDHRAATRFVQERWRPGDAILVDAGYVYTALLTYWEGEPPAWRGRLVSDAGLDYGEEAGTGPVILSAGSVGGDAQLGWGDPRSDFYAMGLEETEAALGRAFAGFSRVWVYRCYDTVTDPDGDIRRWLAAHGQQFEDQVFTGESQLRVQGYSTTRDPLAGTSEVGENLSDGSLELLAWKAPSSPVPVGGSVDLVLVWRVGRLPDDGRSLFAGLIGENGQRWGQTDVRSLGSLSPVESWAAGDVVRTPLRVPVPSGTPPGAYRIEIGWYRFVDAQPVWIAWDSGNLLPAGQVEVTAPPDWQALPLPPVGESLGVRIGQGLTLRGVNGGPWLVAPGGSVEVELVWLGGEEPVEAASTVLVLADDAGQFLAGSLPGTVPAGLAAGQAVRAVARLDVPPVLPAGIYNLAVGRQRADGSWLSVRRGPFVLGATAPLGTVRVVPASGQGN